ncbi:MAG TPA: HD domain-containing phosphohydrolase [Gemmatimonadaceae bacterium]|nr:HD domain-containing phosphohydrolase [Gemmatimonadaceae bacterium]
MSEPARFLSAFAQALSTMALYGDGHPAREKAIDNAFEQLEALQRYDPSPRFSFLGAEVVYGERALRELREWEWGGRLASAGIQRIELQPGVTREEYETFLGDIMARLTASDVDTTEQRQTRATNIRFGAIGVRGATGMKETAEALPTATITYTLGEEAEAVRWLHGEVEHRGELPLVEAEAVVRSLSVAMHGESQVVIPLLELKEFDQYTTTHSMNVSVLAMALAEFMGLGKRDVRAYGVAGLLHDLGKVRIPREILVKPGRLTPEERAIMNRHPADGARIIFASDKQLDLAAVVAYEHHIMLNGGGYPCLHYGRDCHRASRLVHVCDVYDALRTRRPYRDAWESERALEYLESRAGTEFDPDVARAFCAMMRQLDRRLVVVDESTSVQDASASRTAAAPASRNGGSE